MEIVKATKEKVKVQVSVHELTTFSNTLSEVYDTLYASEFKTRMGVSRESVKSLSNSILELLNDGLINRKIVTQFSIDELVTLNNALNEVCNGIKVSDFEVKLGVSRENAKSLLSSVSKMLDGLNKSEIIDVEPL